MSRQTITHSGKPAFTSRDACRVIGLALVLALALALSACATVLPEISYKDNLGRVAVIAVDQKPEVNFSGFALGKGEGAAKGAGGAFAGCLSGLGGGCGGDFCGAVLILMLGICGIAGLVGGVVGAVAAPSGDQVGDFEANLAAAFETRTIQESLRQSVEDAVSTGGVKVITLPDDERSFAPGERDYRRLAAKGVDTVLETTLTKAGTEGGYGVNSSSMAYMQAHVRLVDTATNIEIAGTDYAYQGRRLEFAKWSQKQGQPLIDEFINAYQSLGKHIHEQIFLTYPFPDRSPHFYGFMSGAFGLAPIYPPTRGAFTGDSSFIGTTFEWVAVDELQPRFKWEGFPRESDTAKRPDEMARVSNVRYELLIAREENMGPGTTVYQRSGLIAPEHTIDTSLQPESRYFWTVRAHFELDGRSRATEWGATRVDALGGVTVPSIHCYRFRTPK